MLVRICLATLAIAAASPAYGCEHIWEQETPKLPGETDAEYSNRLNRFADEVRAAYFFNEQGSRLRDAKSAFLAIVEDVSIVDEKKGLRKAVVRPLVSITGELPKQNLTLADEFLTSCGMTGDGDATQAKKSALVFVFASLSGLPNRPRGIDSIMAIDARHPLLTHALYEYLGIEDPNL